MLEERLKKWRDKFGAPSRYDSVTGEQVQDELGREILDPTPMAPPIGYKKQPSMVEIIRDMVKSERLAMEAKAAGFETFEEADDFEIADDEGEMPSSPHENEFDPPVRELYAEGEKAKAAREKEEAAAKAKADKEDADLTDK